MKLVLLRFVLSLRPKSSDSLQSVQGKITSEGIFLEQLETDVGKYLPEVTEEHLGNDVVQININKPMSELRAV